MNLDAPRGPLHLQAVQLPPHPPHSLMQSLLEAGTKRLNLNWHEQKCCMSACEPPHPKPGLAPGNLPSLLRRPRPVVPRQLQVVPEHALPCRILDLHLYNIYIIFALLNVIKFYLYSKYEFCIQIWNLHRTFVYEFIFIRWRRKKEGILKEMLFPFLLFFCWPGSPGHGRREFSRRLEQKLRKA